MSVLAARLDAYQQDHDWIGFPLAVIYKFTDDQGGYLAALITYYGFLSLFPLLLLLITVLGFVLQGDPQRQSDILSSTLAEFPIIGDQLRNHVGTLHGSTLALLIGVLGSLYGATGVTQAAQNAMNTLWAVPRKERPNPFSGRLRSLRSVLFLGTTLIMTTVLSGLFTSGEAFGRSLGTVSTVLAVLVSLLGNAALFLGGFRILTVKDVSFRDLLPGALAASVMWQLLQYIAALLVAHQLKRASELYGLFGIVLGLIGWLYLGAVLTMICAEVNVVRCQRLWPRALLTPFTDDVVLTVADEA